ncbi:MAG: alpha/beta fold hydrolase [Bacteroides sp.]|nr:alpha/beta fold hydrolase [Bacteroides sp.]
MRKKIVFLSTLLIAVLISSPYVSAQNQNEPLIIQQQGSFMVGGTVIENPGEFTFSDYRKPDGQKAYVDHAYTFYQIPPDARKLPLVFLHGGGQSGKTWETTPDGREGFQNIFLRRRFGVYIVDQPRRGRAGATSLPHTVEPPFNNIMVFSLFRFGNYPDLFPGVQFPKDSESMNQILRQATPDTGPYDDDVTSEAMAALFNKIGEGILVTHSRGGYPGWHTALKSSNVKAIISFEPGGTQFVYPEGELPEPITSAYGIHRGVGVPLEEFMKFTRIPIIIYYGDFIAEKPTSHIGQDQWRVELQMARMFVDVVNRYGGDAQVVHLPEIGIKGNTHFPMSDLNNVEIADLVSAWLKEKGLD